MADSENHSTRFHPDFALFESGAITAGLSASALQARQAEDQLINEDGLLAMLEYESLFGPLPAGALEKAAAEIDAALFRSSRADT